MNTFERGYGMIQELVGAKWIPEILFSIDQSYIRYNQIENSIPEISHTELQRKLRMLIEKNAIAKMESGSHTAYQLTEFGCDLVHIFRHFEDISIKYAPDQRF